MRTILRRRVLTGLTVAQFFPQSPRPFLLPMGPTGTARNRHFGS
jgi:hypothetical protein